MEIDKPQISILMAVYDPRMDWLREQLLSLDEQTYPNIKLYIRDDCSPNVPYDEIQSCVQDCIRAFPYEIKRNEKNLGSNGTFELLTQEAGGEYFAYCDQDDIWLPEKLEILLETIEETGALLICSDMFVIDGEGKQVTDSITKVRRHHVFKSGTGLASELLVSNFVTGCTMLVKADCAKEAAPFCPYMVHDQHLALIAAIKGQIISVLKPLIRYRIHGKNQTLAMAGVYDKQSYLQVKINVLIKRMQWLQEQLTDFTDILKEISEVLLWAQARNKNFEGSISAKKTVWKYRKYSPLLSLFEVVMAGMPNSIFMIAVNLKRKNVL